MAGPALRARAGQGLDHPAPGPGDHHGHHAGVGRYGRRDSTHASGEPRSRHVEAEVSLHWPAVTRQQRRLMEVASPYVRKWGGYLAGGTAVALRLGHRRSVDLDYFTRRKVDADSLAADIRSIAKT